MWNLWWVIQQQLDCKSFVEAFAGLKTAKHTYRTFVKSSLIVSRESNVPTRISGIWNCYDIQPRGRRQKVSLVHNSSRIKDLSNSSLTARVLWKLSQGSKLRNIRIVPSSNCRWLLAENPMLLRADQAFGTCKSGYRRRCSRRSGKDCSMLRSPIVHSTKAMIPGYNQAPKWNYCCNEACCTLLTDIL